jgi:hypothetical protein
LEEDILDGSAESIIDVSCSKGTRPVKIQRSLTRDLFVKEREARSVNACVSKEESRVKIWRKESLANVSS